MIRLSAQGVCKSFGPVQVLRGVDFDVHAGAINALLGENGAGKSTLMKIMAGVERHDGGRLLVDGHSVHLDSVQDAAALGIGIVHQELSLCPNLSVKDNIFLDRPLSKGLAIDHAGERAQARRLLQRLGARIDPDAMAQTLPMGERQLVEIARALALDVSVLILDEPTSALGLAEAQRLFAVLDELRATGVGIIYISHRMQEIEAIADHVTVLRDGRSIAHAPRGAFTIPWVVEQMVGGKSADRPARAACKSGADILRCDGLTVLRADGAPIVDDVRFTVRAGEVTALYGLLGAGRTELFETIYGVRRGQGAILIEDADISALSLRQRQARGVAFIAEDRQHEAIFPNLNVMQNASLPILERLRRGLFLSAYRERDVVAPMLDTMRVKTPSLDAPIGALSGGNQQKLLIGRALLCAPRLVMLDEPGRGVDVAARAEIFERLRALASSGVAIFFATSDLVEATSAADRVLVMAAGRITGDFSGDAIGEEALVRAASDIGIKAEQIG